MAESGTWQSAWKSLSDGGEPGSVVLAIDFDTTGRPEARFADLVANLGTDLRVWESVPPVPQPGSKWTGADYVEHWVKGLAQERHQVKALMGFCAGSVYAAALAERIEPWQDDPPMLLLFDPELSTSQTLMWQFHKVIGFLSSVISAEEIAQTRDAGEQVLARVPELGPLKDELISLMREAGEPALIRAGLDEQRRNELFDVFHSFLSYLAGAGDIDPIERWQAATAFSSFSPLSGLNAMRQYAAGTGAEELTVGKEIRIDVDHGTMLADKELALAVTELLR